MAGLLTNAQNTYAQIGIREDLADMVYRIDPEETPFQSNISTKGRCKNTLVEWQTQALAAPATNYQLEGDVNLTITAATNRVRLQNRCAISRKTYAVTGTGQAVDIAGVENEMDEQRLLKGLEIKRDMEVTLLANQAYDAGGTTTVRKCAGLPAYITNVGADPSISGLYTVGSGTGSLAWNYGGYTVTQNIGLTALNNGMKNAYIQGGSPKMLMLSPGQKVKFSSIALAAAPAGLAPLRYNLNSVQQGALIGAVDIWQSDFNKVEVVVNRQMAYDTAVTGILDRTAFLIDPRYVSVEFLRAMQTTPLAKIGDADQEMVIAEYTLKVGAPKAHAIIPALTQ